VPASKALLCKLEAARRGKALGVGHGWRVDIVLIKKGLTFGIFWMEKWWFWVHSSVYDSRGHAGHTWYGGHQAAVIAAPTSAAGAWMLGW
jgi:hypothetical protein